MLTLLAIAAATFASEDLTCIATGLLIQRGAIGAIPGIAACTVGIFVGDIGLWALGRLGGAAAFKWRWLTKTTEFALVSGRRWLASNAAAAIVSSRFLPGTRVGLYVTSGVLGLSGATFALWAFAAAILWTPAIVLSTAALGHAFVGPFTAAIGSWRSPVVLAAAVTGLLGAVRRLAAKERRERLLRWEFWPMWIFYAPVALWIAMLAVWHRGLSTITAANPGMPDGGTVGESKFEILERLPRDSTIPAVLVPAAAGRFGAARAQIEAAGWPFPLVMKPDVGQRGIGVRLARSWADLDAYLSEFEPEVIVQPYHRGPFEAGIFYYRYPSWPRGRIFSITDKCFPELVGDGRSTLATLILGHPRYRLQAATFCARHAAILSQVLAKGERFRLTIAGNHAQGTMFRDGGHLLTPALERRIDEIARQYPGFYIGRFDIRYESAEELGDEPPARGVRGLGRKSALHRNVSAARLPVHRSGRLRRASAHRSRGSGRGCAAAPG